MLAVVERTDRHRSTTHLGIRSRQMLALCGLVNRGEFGDYTQIREARMNMAQGAHGTE